MMSPILSGLESSVVSAKRYESSKIVHLNFKTKEELDIAIAVPKLPRILVFFQGL